MKERVVTLMWGTAWERYGRKFVETFQRHWPESVELLIVTDKALPIEDDRIRQTLLDDVPGYVEFMTKHRNDPRANGLGHNPRKVDKDGKDWIHDAVKWAPQGLAPVAALDDLDDGDLLAWLDADVETTADVPRHWINILLAGNDLACLQRGTQHPEIGFWAVRIGVEARALIARFADLYRNGGVFDLRQWHSGFVFGEALERSSVSINNLNPRLQRGHPWPFTALASYTVHKKGKIKDG